MNKQTKRKEQKEENKTEEKTKTDRTDELLIKEPQQQNERQEKINKRRKHQ